MPTNDEAVASRAVLFLKNMVAQKKGGETREQQIHAVEAIEHAIANKSNLILQAGTGTGKTFSYLAPAVLATAEGKKFVISTATKQLSEQIFKTDIPMVREFYRREMGRDFKVELLKGRENYACHNKFDPLMKMDELDNRETLVDDEDLAEIDEEFAERSAQAQEFVDVFKWLENTKTGDRTDAPAVSDKTWKALSSNNFECIGAKKCPFSEKCFSEHARAKAKAADIVVTNHAILGHDMMTADDEGEGVLLGHRDGYIADETHQLPEYLTSAWSQKITIKLLQDTIKQIRTNPPQKASQRTSHETVLKDLDRQMEIIEKEFENLETGLFSEIPLSPKLEKALRDFMEAVIRSDAFYDSRETAKEVQTVNSNLRAVEALNLFLWDSPENVRSAKVPYSQWDKEPASIMAQPLRIGPRLMEKLNERDAFLIGTSATISTGGNFRSAVQEFALNEEITDGENVSYPPRPFNTLDVGTPFDFARQAMWYIPSSKTFPSPDFKTRDEHAEATTEQIVELVNASNGSALVLTTQTKRVKELKEALEAGLPSHIRVLGQGDMPNANLIDEFKADKHSVLVGTMGFWEGVDAPGDTCILVCIDKMPFAVADDPLMKARKKHVDENGGNGFMQVILPFATRKLAQAFGRLVRSKTDRGVVALFDTRIQTARYGTAVKATMPAKKVYDDLDVVKGALRRLSGQD